MDSTLDTIIAAVSAKPLTGIEVPGTVLSGTPRRYVHRLYDVYLRLGEHALLRCSASEDQRTLELSLTDRVALDFEILEDAEYAVASITALRLARPESPHRFVKATFVATDAEEARTGRVDCAAFELDDGDGLFFDPMTISGLRIAGPGAYERWIEEFGAERPSR